MQPCIYPKIHEVLHALDKGQRTCRTRDTAGENGKQRRDELCGSVGAAQSASDADEGQGDVWAPVQAQQQRPLEVLAHYWQGQPDCQPCQRLHVTQLINITDHSMRSLMGDKEQELCLCL